MVTKRQRTRATRRTTHATRLIDIPGHVLAAHGELDASSVRALSLTSRSLLRLANDTGLRDTSRGGQSRRKTQRTRVDPVNSLYWLSRDYKCYFANLPIPAIDLLQRNYPEFMRIGENAYVLDFYVKHPEESPNHPLAKTLLKRGRRRSPESALSRAQFKREIAVLVPDYEAPGWTHQHHSYQEPLSP